jgi:hypothetical protein
MSELIHALAADPSSSAISTIVASSASMPLALVGGEGTHQGRVELFTEDIPEGNYVEDLRPRLRNNSFTIDEYIAAIPDTSVMIRTAPQSVVAATVAGVQKVFPLSASEPITAAGSV